ncbi:hypothetical protein ABFS82_10G061300 [Erythranthe guttata]
MNSPNQEKNLGILASKWDWVKGKMVNAAKTTKKIGTDDPRRVIHAMKVGLTLTLVSLFYYFRPLYDSFGESAICAILTVVVVFEFTVGGTLSKSLNRGGATVLGAAIGIGAKSLAAAGGERGEPVIRGFLVFIITGAATYTRFLPIVKRKYDYGGQIFIVTFSLVAVSGYRVNHILQMSHQRLATVLMGGAACILISIFVCPVWAGRDLHNLVAENIEKLADFLDGFGDEFFSCAGDGEEGDEKPFLTGYKSVLDSEATEDSLAQFAWWEPPHGGFKLCQPWKEYLKIGNLARECAHHIQTLGECLIHSKPQVASEIHRKIEKTCTTMSKETGKALREVSSTIKEKRFPSPSLQSHIQKSKSEGVDLITELEEFSLPLHDLQETMKLFVVASTLCDIVRIVEEISVSVAQLSTKARFENPKSTPTYCDKQRQLATVEPLDNIDQCKDCVVIDVHEQELRI